MPRVGLFIAADIGLEKTIEAGHIDRELPVEAETGNEDYRFTFTASCARSGRMSSRWQMNEITAHIDSSGRLVVPAALRKELGLTPGAAVTLRVTDGELRVVARSEAVRLAQERVRKYVQPGRRLADELIAERRAEWKRG